MRKKNSPVLYTLPIVSKIYCSLRMPDTQSSETLQRVPHHQAAHPYSKCGGVEGQCRPHHRQLIFHAQRVKLSKEKVPKGAV
jgi:hypothetical protein